MILRTVDFQTQVPQKGSYCSGVPENKNAGNQNAMYMYIAVAESETEEFNLHMVELSTMPITVWPGCRGKRVAKGTQC